MLSGKCIVLGVTGGIAAYKACEIVSRLKKLHANVRVVMTEHACRFVAPALCNSSMRRAVSSCSRNLAAPCLLPAASIAPIRSSVISSRRILA